MRETAEPTLTASRVQQQFPETSMEETPPMMSVNKREEANRRVKESLALDLENAEFSREAIKRLLHM